MGNETTFSLPRWRITCWLAHAGDDVPEDIRRELVKSLYGTLPIFAGGIINTVAVSALIWWRMGGPVFASWLLCEAALCAIRLAVLLHARYCAARGRPTPTDAYLVLGALWAFSVGFGTYISISSGDWVSAALACLSAAAMVGGMCFRNYGAPRLVAVMILFSLGPCAVAAVMSGEPIMLIAALQIPFYLVSMTIAAYRLNAMLVSTMMAERENDRRARHDALTGLLNRSGLEHAFKRWFRKGGRSLSLFYLDLDGFKSVNDRYGHAAGDQLLKQIAARLRASPAEAGIIARIGGDEFVMISPVGEKAAARLCAERIIAKVAGAGYPVEGGEALIGVSIGVAQCPAHGTGLASLLRAADAALYEAKASGRNRCVVASERSRSGEVSITQDAEALSRASMA